MEIQKINFINNIPVKNHHFHEHQDKNKYGFKLFMTSAFIGPPRRAPPKPRKQQQQQQEPKQDIPIIYYI